MERFNACRGTVAAWLAICCVIVCLTNQSGSNAVTPDNRKSVHSRRISLNARQLWETTRHTGPVWSIDFSSNGKSLASASWDQSVNLWEPSSGTLLKTLHRELEIMTVAFSPDSKTLAIGGYDKSVSLLDSNTLELQSQLRAHSGYVSAIAFSPD